MVSKKNTKKALLMSALSLLLCCSMLIGTTFAWFTDEVTSGKNQIIAGNLDVELEYAKVVDGQITGWDTVAGKTAIFDPNALWEPGHTEVVYLRISNLGTLALKYGLKMTFRDTVIGKSVDGNDIYLSEHLEYAVVDVSAKFASRDDARLEAEKTAQPLTEYTDNGVMKTKGEIKTVALVVYMPENVGNEANYRGEKIPQIELGLSLFATQYTHEEDSFDELYDKATAVFTIEDAQALVDAGEDATLVNCHEPNGVLYADAAYTGTLTLVNSTIKAVQAEGDLDLVVLGDVVVNAKGTGISAFAVRPTENGSAISAKGKLSISGKGNLTAVAADVNGAFGIGGMEVKEIAIKDVTIDYVSGGYAYDVGSDTKYYKDAPEGGAAIGSGYDGAEISLSNVHVVKAIGGSKAAAIGARYWTGVTVNITNSTIGYAEGGASAAGIGGSRVSGNATESGTTINITNSTVTAKGGAYGAGIGSGYDTHCLSEQPLCTINIDGSTINATGGQYAAGVGTGYHNAALAGEIKNSTVDAVSGEKFYKATYTQAQDIGFGVTDPAREGKQTGSKLIYNGTEIGIPGITVENADALVKALQNGGNVTLVGTIDMNGGTVEIPNGTTISGGTVENARLTVADDSGATFKGVTFSDTVSVEAKGDGSLSFVDCKFNVHPQKLNGFSRGAAIIGANQYYELDLHLENCTFNYQYETGDADLWNAAIFMWSNVDDCVIKNCTFNDYGFVAVKLMNVAEGAEIVLDGNTFNMCEASAANYFNNDAVQIMPQHDNAFSVVCTNNTFNGAYDQNTVVDIEGMSGLTLTKYTLTQSGNTINDVAATDVNFEIQ